jgi:ribosome assembly protein 1
MLEKITKSLNLTIPPHILRSRESRNILMHIFSSWLPLSTAVLVSVIEYLPSPRTAQAARLPEMIKESPGANFIHEKIRDSMISFKTGPEDPVVAYVSKMVAIPESELPKNTKRVGASLTADEARELARKKREEIARIQAEANGEQTDDFSRVTSALASTSLDEPAEEKADKEHLIGFARLYSGTLTVGDPLYVLPPKFSPANPHASPEPRKVTITNLYLLMGRGLEPLKSVPAGVVFGVEGLAGHVLKTGTLCSQLEGSVNLAGVTMTSPPIVRVALEPVNPADLNKMITGLKLLEQSDPCAQYEVLPSGEHVVLTAGELHLERCLKDLRERFARCDIQAGEPIVPYRESIVSAAEMAAPNHPDLGRGGVLTVSPSKQLTIKLRVVPLPEGVTDFLTKNVGTLKRQKSEKGAKTDPKGTEAEETSENIENREVEDAEESLERNVLSLDDFKKELQKLFGEAKNDELWHDAVEKIAAFGPRWIGPNVLVDSTTANTSEKL